MSANMDFQSMSDEQLRNQMEAFGMPKVPVTASTRAILIKRLEKHVKSGAGPSTGKLTAKNRRETIAVVKYSSDDDSDRDAAKEKLKKKLDNHKNARRLTIGAASPTATTPTADKSRRSVRGTPVKLVGPSPEPKRVVTDVPVIIEDSDDDEQLLAAVEKTTRRSKSKTPTLSKSDVVTTSYKQVVSTVPEEVDLEEADEVPPIKSPPPMISQRIAPVGVRESSNASRDSPLRRTTMGESYSSDSSRLNRDYGAAASTSGYNRHSTYTSTYANSKTTTTSSRGSDYSRIDRQPMEQEEAAGAMSNAEDFPYLRDFSKRLSRLKADPLYSSGRASIRSSRTDSPATATYRYRSMTPRQTTHFWDPIGMWLARLEQQYALKRKVAVLAILLTLIFVAVLFWN